MVPFAFSSLAGRAEASCTGLRRDISANTARPTLSLFWGSYKTKSAIPGSEFNRVRGG